MTAWPTMPDQPTERQAWAFFDHFRRAIDERSQALGRRHFPAEAFTWYEGTVDLLEWDGTDILLHDAAQAWPGPPDPPAGTNYPDDFDVVIEPGDETTPQSLLRLDVASYAEGVITLSGLNYAHPDAMDLSNYNGRRYRIVTGYAFPSSPDWSQRIMQWPNVWPADAVVVTAVSGGGGGDDPGRRVEGVGDGGVGGISRGPGR